MRALMMVFGSFGLVLGLLCAALAPYLAFGWFAYTPISATSAYESTLSLGFDRSPTLAILPAAGLLPGLLVAVALHFGRWRLRRG